MTDHSTMLTIDMPAGGYQRSVAVASVRDAELPEGLLAACRGPFGLPSLAVTFLEACVEAVDLGLAAAAALQGLILGEARTGTSFVLPELTPAQADLVGAFQLVVTLDALQRRAAPLLPAPEVAGAMELDGLGDLLAGGREPPALAGRALRLMRRYLELHAPAPAEPGADRRALTTMLAFSEMLRRAVLLLAGGGQLKALLPSLEARAVTVAGHRYRGLAVQAARPDSSGLLPVWPEDVVGNEAYLQAGLKLARDVAGYDFQARRNPKRVNPVLFGLGRPGCGKTLTAHAIGNDFLRYAAERNVPARFLVVRRTDWASSYQNASALNLVRIFREEVHGFDGVCGVYWADIDTAVASRSSDDLRMEEKQNLGALFGLFDGTILPKDGKWFLICDANTVTMDEAAVSRIAQNPFTVEGPTTAAHHVRLMRDLQLRDLREYLPAGEDEWQRLGGLAVELKLSGRAVESICGNVRARVQDFEYPDEYFRATGEERQAILRRHSRQVSEGDIARMIRDWHGFQAEAAARADRQRFQSEVDSLVRQLNASRAAAEKIAGG